ncbi:MAG: GGDEF domain-containing protein, partial [Mesoflavibacter sp.]|nr:GGDEF domain-containing protein [Mesoflavibacter sp.]
FDVCCLFIDINDFKKLNDTYGHEIGDQALILLANTLKTHLREADIVGRLGGDEFVAVMQISDRSKLSHIIDKIKIEYTNALLENNVCALTLSIGESFTNKQKQPFDTLLNLADHQMYKNKQAYKLVKKA